MLSPKKNEKNEPLLRKASSGGAYSKLDVEHPKLVAGSMGASGNHHMQNPTMTQIGENKLLDEHPHEDEGMRRWPGLCMGTFDECKRRLPKVGEDWKTAVQQPGKMVSAGLYMFLISLFSTVALAVVLQNDTKQKIGLVEYLIVTSVAGMINAIFGTQPLIVMRPVAPVSDIIVKLDEFGANLGLDFFDFLAATGVVVCIYMCLISAFELQRLVNAFSPFTHDVFAVFVCSLNLKFGFVSRHERFNEGPNGEAIWELLLFLYVVGLCLILANAIHWPNFSVGMRQFLSDYAMAIAVITATAISYVFPEHGENAMHVVRLQMPDLPTPSCWFSDTEHVIEGGTEVCFFSHTAGTSPRPWATAFSSPNQGKTWGIAIAAAIPVTFFIYIDHNVSSLLCQLPGLGITRGYYYYQSGIICGLSNLVGAILGMPLITGSLPDSPQMVRALQTADGKVAENRATPLITFALIGLPLFVPQILRVCPAAVIDGVLVYAGIDGIIGTDMFFRCVHLMTVSSEFPKIQGDVTPWRVKWFTILQCMWLAICWIIGESPAGLLVAFVFVIMVPFQWYGLKNLFTEEELAVLDPEEHGGGGDHDDVLSVAPHKSTLKLSVGTEFSDPIRSMMQKSKAKGLSIRSRQMSASLHPTTAKLVAPTVNLGGVEYAEEEVVNRRKNTWSISVPGGWQKNDHRLKLRQVSARQARGVTGSAGPDYSGLLGGGGIRDIQLSNAKSPISPA